MHSLKLNLNKRQEGLHRRHVHIFYSKLIRDEIVSSRDSPGRKIQPNSLQKPEQSKKNPATTYSPTRLPEQYHRH